MARLLDIARELAPLRRGMKESELAQYRQERDREARELAITPEGGWPGKNEQERKAARELACAKDDTLRKIAAQIDAEREKQSRMSGDIQALEDERRALEYEIRDRLAVALGGRENPESATGADALIDRAIDQALRNTPPEDEIPF